MSLTTTNAVDRLKSLLGPIPTHPWSALIPQLLLWSFRRYCIDKLFDPDTTSLLDTVWEDHFQLIHLYAPKGLRTITTSWITPENLERMHSQPVQYNEFFLDFLKLVDEALQKEDEGLQDFISDFLDIQVRATFKEWLPGTKANFLIYPMREDNDDEFTDEQFMNLIQSLLKYGRDIKTNTEKPEGAEVGANQKPPLSPQPPPLLKEQLQEQALLFPKKQAQEQTPSPVVQQQPTLLPPHPPSVIHPNPTLAYQPMIQPPMYQAPPMYPNISPQPPMYQAMPQYPMYQSAPYVQVPQGVSSPYYPYSMQPVPPSQVPLPPAPLPPTPLPPAPLPPAPLPPASSPPTSLPPSEAAFTSPLSIPSLPDPVPEPRSEEPKPQTVGEAIERRRHTYRRHGRRANRGTTLRSGRVRANTRKVPPHSK